MPRGACPRRAGRARIPYAPGVDTVALDSLRIVLDPVGQAGVAIALMLLMGSIALGLRLEDFAALRQQGRILAGGLLAQLLGLPLVTWIVVSLVDLPASLALGMIVVACCPGGAVSNFLTWLAGGNVACSVALTTASSALAAVLTPASILFWSGAHPPTAALLARIDVSPLVFLGQTTALLLVPLAVGMLLAARFPSYATSARGATARLGAAVLLGVIIYGGWHFLPALAAVLPILVAIVIAHNAIAFALGAVAGAVLGAEPGVRKALVFEIGIQNSGLALVILLSSLKGIGGAAAIAAIWGVWHIVAGGLIVLWMRRRDRQQR